MLCVHHAPSACVYSHRFSLEFCCFLGLQSTVDVQVLAALLSFLLDQGRTRTQSPTVHPHCRHGDVPRDRLALPGEETSNKARLCSTLWTTRKFHEPSFNPSTIRNWTRKGKLISTSKETRVFLTQSQHPRLLQRSGTA